MWRNTNRCTVHSVVSGDILKICLFFSFAYFHLIVQPNKKRLIGFKRQKKEKLWSFLISRNLSWSIFSPVSLPSGLILLWLSQKKQEHLYTSKKKKKINLTFLKKMSNSSRPSVKSVYFIAGKTLQIIALFTAELCNSEAFFLSLWYFLR